MEAKNKINYNEKDIEHTYSGGTLDQVNKEFLYNII